MAKLHVKKGDSVLVIAGKDKGKIGKVLITNPSDSTVVVEGVNFQVKHKKARSAEDKGGILKREGKIHSSNVQVYDTVAKKGTRVYNKVVNGKKVRVSKDGNVLDVARAKKTNKKSAEKKVAEKKVAEKPEKVEKATAKTTTAKTTTKPAAKTAAKTTTAKPAASTTVKKTAAKTTTTRARNQER